MTAKSKQKYTSFIQYAEAGLSRAAVRQARKQAEEEILGLKLARLRKEFGIKQVDIENFSQSGVSKIEARKDMKVSTLIDYVRSLGLELEIKVRTKRTAKNPRKKELTLIKSA